MTITSLTKKYAMDIDEIGLSTDVPLLKLDMFCPELGETLINRGNNWSREQCILRVRLDNPCTRNCPHGQKIRAELEATGEDWKLTPFQIIYVSENEEADGETRKLSQTERKKRNLKIAIQLVSGISAEDVSIQYSMSKHYVRQVTYNCIRNLDQKMFDKRPTKEKLEYLRQKKSHFLPLLIQQLNEMEPTNEILQD